MSIFKDMVLLALTIISMFLVSWFALAVSMNDRFTAAFVIALQICAVLIARLAIKEGEK
jgi:hypothetical protein